MHTQEDPLDADMLAAAAGEVKEFAKTGLRDDSPSRRLRLLERAPLLRGLSPVQAAGSDSRAQFAYLVQAIADAIDEIGKTASPVAIGPSVGSASGGAREARALRALFGFTDQTRIKTWRARQEAAANTLNVSWDHFRHDVQEPLLRSLGEHILHATLEGDQPLSSLSALSPALSAFATQKDVESLLVDYIYNMRPQRASMLELSTATTGSILRALRDVGTHIRLLAANPERSPSGWQRLRANRSLVNLLNIDFREYDALSLRLYGVPPSLRGRAIGDVIAVGWYTHRDNTRLDALDPASNEVWGHDNVLIVSRTSDRNGAVLSRWFSREFERLWSHRATHDELVSARILGRQE